MAVEKARRFLKPTTTAIQPPVRPGVLLPLRRKGQTDALSTGRGPLKGASGTCWMRDPYVHDSQGKHHLKRDNKSHYGTIESTVNKSNCLAGKRIGRSVRLK